MHLEEAVSTECMKPFEYIAPKDISQAFNSLEEFGEESKLMAGGTDLLVQLKQGHLAPKVLIDLKKISGLSGIRFEESTGLHIGALTSVAEIESSKIIRVQSPVLFQAAGLLGSVQVRNKATIGGNICRAAPSGDLIPPLLVLNSKVIIKSLNGKRIVDLEDFFLGSGKTTLKKNEILTEILVPPPKVAGHGVYIKHGRRKSVDLAVVGVAVFLSLNPESFLCERFRLALASVAPVPMRAYEAEIVLHGNKITESLIDSCADAAMKTCNPISDVYGKEWFKRELVKVLVSRAIKNAAHLQGMKL